ncbi:MauE/DoxX family redox-associated membrane protein [Streptomyces cyaneus]|uniref:MauE/DoxX family redox-associated membrane protein n=1 Tax=Streptomyces cyaneus TaxID=1904 RepID=UPI0013E3C46E|nr:MauE/DoxX family redox-associated membrane protein [Streptomyces cyaneus]
MDPASLTVARVALAVVWVAASVAKATRPAAAVAAVRAHRPVVVAGAARQVAAAIVAVELVLGVLLASGLAVRAAAVASSLLLLAFTVSAVSTAAYPLPGAGVEPGSGCGCFGRTGRQQGARLQAAPSNPGYIVARNSLLVVVSVALALPPGHSHHP